jgi:hypothetical protein
VEDTIDLHWRKSSYSGNGGGSCVEVADHDSRVLVATPRTTVTAPCCGSLRTFGDGSLIGSSAR